MKFLVKIEKEIEAESKKEAKVNFAESIDWVNDHVEVKEVENTEQGSD